MSILFFTNKITDQHQAVLEAIVKFMECDIQVLNIPQHRPESHVKNNTVVVSFGKLAGTLVEQCIQEKRLVNVHHTKLAHPQQLLPTTENKVTREDALTQLTSVKEVSQEARFHPTGVTVTERDLPALQATQLLLLKKLTDEEGERTCFQTTKGGTLIEICTDHKENSKADVCLTFSEVFAIRSIMDILRVSEVDFVSSSQDSST